VAAKADRRGPAGRAGPAKAPGRHGRAGVERLTGLHCVREALRARRRPLRTLHVLAGVREGEAEALVGEAARAGVRVERPDRARLEELAGPGARSQGVLLEAGPLPELDLPALIAAGEPGSRCVVALDGVEDPQNVGALARVAEAAGAAGLLLTRRRAPLLTAAVSRASAGALEHLPVARVANLPRALQLLAEAGFWSVGADTEAEGELFAAPDRFLRGDVVLVLGAEGRGLRRGVRAGIDHPLRIPMAGRIASLNVATAAAVLLYERLRRLRASPTAG